MKAPDELWSVARSLGDILGEVVFVGGMIRELLITDPAAGAARPTQDVDCIVDVDSWGDYQVLANRLRAHRFAECTDEGAPLCRWVVDQLRVDVMPIEPVVLGFSNVWYPSAVHHAIEVQGPDVTIRIVDAVHFCATKVEAFLGRGDGDYQHHDMEDLMAVVDARPELLNEIRGAPNDVREFISDQVRSWLEEEAFLDSLAGHLHGDTASQARRPLLLKRLGEIAALMSSTTEAGPLRVAPAPQTPVARHGAASRHGPVPTGSAMPMGRVLLRSTNLAAAEYDPSTRTLVVEFRSGTMYRYSRVPPNLYVGLMRAGSHGRYFNQWIKDRGYGDTRLR